MPETGYNRDYNHPNVIKYPTDIQVGDMLYWKIRDALYTAFTR